MRRFRISAGLALVLYKEWLERSIYDPASVRSTMSQLTRTGLSLDRELLSRFDSAIAKKKYNNRSEAVRDLIRDYLVSQEADSNRVVVGTLTIVYDHHQPNLTEKLVEAQHHAGGRVMAATHV